MNCYRDEYDWCTYHDVPFVIDNGNEVCSSSLGVNDVTGSLPHRMHERIADLHSDDDCDHSDCFSGDDVEEAREEGIPKQDVRALLDMIERGQLDALELNLWRERVADREWTPAW